MNAENHSAKKPLTAEQAYQKLTAFCSFRDRTRKEVSDKLASIGTSKDMAKKLILKLEEEGYLNEERMAQAYAGGKFRVKAWGKKKIEVYMRQLGLKEALISEGLSQIKEEEYLEKLQYLAKKKWDSLKKEDKQNKLAKTARYLAGKGYESDKVWEVINRLKE